MVMKLDEIVPFGRSLDEYIKMFHLTSADLALKILGVADGPASFNAELTAEGGKVTSVDPVYQFSAQQINDKYQSVVDGIIEQVQKSPEDWVWTYHNSPADLKANRDRVTRIFVEDFRTAAGSDRYVVGALPILPFADDEFDLALCSHFLFLYSNHLDCDFHLKSIQEMLRVAREVRIFPLLTLMREPSPYIEELERKLSAEGYSVAVKKVEYEFQRGGDRMMVVRQTN